jgi:hypothetical protein
MYIKPKKFSLHIKNTELEKNDFFKKPKLFLNLMISKFANPKHFFFTKINKAGICQQ